MRMKSLSSSREDRKFSVAQEETREAPSEVTIKSSAEGSSARSALSSVRTLDRVTDNKHHSSKSLSLC